jgi:hypothetical protein
MPGKTARGALSRPIRAHRTHSCNIRAKTGRGQTRRCRAIEIASFSEKNNRGRFARDDSSEVIGFASFVP